MSNNITGIAIVEVINHLRSMARRLQVKFRRTASALCWQMSQSFLKGGRESQHNLWKEIDQGLLFSARLYKSETCDHVLLKTASCISCSQRTRCWNDVCQWSRGTQKVSGHTVFWWPLSNRAYRAFTQCPIWRVSLADSEESNPQIDTDLTLNQALNRW